MSKTLEAAREKQRQLREAGIKPEILTPPEKAAKEPKSLRCAIDAKCWDCVGGDADPGPKGRIRDCHIETCSLWPVRPYQDYMTPEDKPEGIQDPAQE